MCHVWPVSTLKLSPRLCVCSFFCAWSETLYLTPPGIFTRTVERDIPCAPNLLPTSLTKCAVKSRHARLSMFSGMMTKSAKKKSFTALVQVNSYKTVTTLSANETVLYHLHVVMMNATLSFRRFLIVKGIFIVGFLLVDEQTEGHFDANINYNNREKVELVPSKCIVALMTSSFAQESKLTLVRSAIQQILKPLENLLSRWL